MTSAPTSAAPPPDTPQAQTGAASQRRSVGGGPVAVGAAAALASVALVLALAAAGPRRGGQRMVAAGRGRRLPHLGHRSRRPRPPPVAGRADRLPSLAFGAIALAAVAVDPAVGRYVLAAGWLGARRLGRRPPPRRPGRAALVRRELHGHRPVGRSRAAHRRLHLATTPLAQPSIARVSTTEGAAPCTSPPSHTDLRDLLDVVVIGAGQAGLAVGHHLAARGADFVLLDAGTGGRALLALPLGLAAAVQPRAVRLAARDAVPGAGRHPPDQGRRRRLPGRLRRPLRPAGAAEHARCSGCTATTTAPSPSPRPPACSARGRSSSPPGRSSAPLIPAVAAELDPLVTAAAQRRVPQPGTAAHGGRVLVVGAANSGLQIAAELADTCSGHRRRRLRARWSCRSGSPAATCSSG